MHCWPSFPYFLGSRQGGGIQSDRWGDGLKGACPAGAGNQGPRQRAAREEFCFFVCLFPARHSPQELAESLVVGDGLVVVLSEAVLDVLQAPLLHQLAGRLGLLEG